MADLRPNSLTWTALLGKWVQFAQASVAIPTEADGEQWRACVPAIINLQAVTFAIADLKDLPQADRPVARDKASILIEEASKQIEHAWAGQARPEALVEIEADARAALEASVAI